MDACNSRNDANHSNTYFKPPRIPSSGTGRPAVFRAANTRTLFAFFMNHHKNDVDLTLRKMRWCGSDESTAY
eukprot:scaffold2084_cov155-Skeletonema_menzelii.AAC.8